MKKATAAQKRMFEEVKSVGCMACLENDEELHTIPEIHHVRKHGYRDHNKVFGLCPTHHRPTHGITGIVNRHGNPKEFRERYGTDEELLEKCRSRIRK